jgi:hypothetical protein
MLLCHLAADSDHYLPALRYWMTKISGPGNTSESKFLIYIWFSSCKGGSCISVFFWGRGTPAHEPQGVPEPQENTRVHEPPLMQTTLLLWSGDTGKISTLTQHKTHKIHLFVLMCTLIAVRWRCSLSYGDPTYRRFRNRNSGVKRTHCEWDSMQHFIPPGNKGL